MTQPHTCGDFERFSRVASSRKDRYRAGKALRFRVPRESHAECPPAGERDAIDLLVETDRRRIPALLPLRYQRMTASPFGFLRGAAAVMARDLAGLPAVGIKVQACGDCHVKNFGAFTSPEGRILFDINDFDETLANVDFTFDLKRLTASVAVFARDRNLPDKSARVLATAAARGYREFMHELCKRTPAEIWQTHMDVHREVQKVPAGKIRDTLVSILDKTEKKLARDDNFPAFSVEDGIARIDDRKGLIEHLDQSFDLDGAVDIRSLFANYPSSLLPERRSLLDRYSLRDWAFKVVGTGSIGTYCAIGLFLSRDEEPLYLQIKEARPSVLAETNARRPSATSRGRDIVDGQRALQAASDVFLGWTGDQGASRQFYVRQLKQRRLDDIFDDVFDKVGKKFEPMAIQSLADLCGRTLARAHARTGDPALLAGYMGKSGMLDEILASFAMAYADNTKYDHARLEASIDSSTGRPSR